ncbi:MAG: peptide deformylase [Dysgonomonas sp.]
MTKSEIALINKEAVNVPMRVLLITNEQDYLILREKSSDIKDIVNNKDLQLLIDRLKVTLSIENGVGIAAPQVGINKNIFLFMRIDKPGNPVQVAINPRIVAHSEETVCFENDGCLSVPDMSGNSNRWTWVDVEYRDQNNNLIKERLDGYSRRSNYTGVIFQHEYDHLQGTLFIDKLCDK